jgi:UDP-N-acetylmuramoyl-L-alanyl-D-glutamate--2,6-diaminopimelate ligase
MLLKELIAGLPVRPAGCVIGGIPGMQADDLRRFAEVRICDLTEDSRTVVPGSLFVARSGLKADGKDYMLAALKAGAVAVLTDDPIMTSPRGFEAPVLFTKDVPAVTGLLAERFYGKPASQLAIAGVTGTNGKTTISYLIWQMMNTSARRCGLAGTVMVDDGREVARAAMTTPPAIELSRTFASMVECGCVAAAIETSSHALHQKRVDALRFKVGVYTNLTGDHLDYHQGLDDYAAAKSRLFELLPKDGLAVINASDWYGKRMVRKCKAPVLWCEVAEEDAPAHEDGEWCRVSVLDEAISGMRVVLTGPWGRIETSVSLIGRYNAMNILQSAAACYALGLDLAEIERGLRSVTAPPGRLERVSEPDDEFQVFVDYAHSDDSLKNVLMAVGGVMPGRRHAVGLLADAAGATSPASVPGRLRVVFGCGGERDTTKRPRMGKAAAELADDVIVTSDNPRSERPSDIVDQVLAGIAPELRHKVTVQVDRARAIRGAIEAAQPGDVIIIAGKGHETEQILPDSAGGTYTIHFDDREHARAALAERRPPKAEKQAGKAKGGASGAAKGTSKTVGRRGPARASARGGESARWGKKGTG